MVGMVPDCTAVHCSVFALLTDHNSGHSVTLWGSGYLSVTALHQMLRPSSDCFAECACAGNPSPLRAQAKTKGHASNKAMQSQSFCA